MDIEQKVAEDLAKGAEDLTAKRDEKCVPLAYQFLTELAKTKGKLGSQGKLSQMQVSWEEVARKMLEKYLDKNLTVEETDYVCKLVLQAVEFSQQLIFDTLKQNLTKLQKKVFDVPRLDEIPLKKLDELVKG